MTSSDDDDRMFQDALSSEHDDDAFPFAIHGDGDGDNEQKLAELAVDEDNNYEALFPDAGEIAANSQEESESGAENNGGSAGLEKSLEEGPNDGHEKFLIGEDEDGGDGGDVNDNDPASERDAPSHDETGKDPVGLSSALLDDVNLADRNGAPDDSHEESPTTPIPIPQSASSGESWEPVEDNAASLNNSVQYELLPGLFAHLSDDAVVGLHDVESYTASDADANNNCQLFDVIVSAKKACLGSGSFLLGGDVTTRDGYVVTARDVTIRAQLVKPRDTRDDWDVMLRDMNISVRGGLELDPQADRTHVVDFLAKFGCGTVVKDEADAEASTAQPSMPARRMTKEEWQQFLRNVREDKRGSEKETQRDAEQIDFLVPNVKVFEVSCHVAKETTIHFPQCQGTATCTLRTLLEYYFRSILNVIDEERPCNPQLDGRYSVADVTSVKGSIVGAACGAAVAGPIGFLAGSYLGSQLGRKHSSAVLGATAGCFFGPVGLIAGACVGESRRTLNVGASASAFGQSTTETIGQSTASGVASAAAAHVASNKYEYAGTAGVVAGATAGSVAGPVGMVAGAFLGSVSARKATENASSAAAEVGEREGRRGYSFGDITRGLVARGKEARGADRREGYQFGDFTRGLLGSAKKGG